MRLEDKTPKDFDSRAVVSEEFVLFYTIESHSVDFLVLEASGVVEDGTVYPLADDEAEAAEVFAIGGLKWDGCINIYFGPHYTHFCGLSSAVATADLFRAIYGIAAKELDTWDAELAE